MICILFSCCRHILAALHFNFNLHRDNKVNQDASVSLKVTYPKFKNGEATVRNRKIEPNFDYVGELFKFYMTLRKQQLQDACNDMKKMVPQPMNSMLDKQPREEAIRMREKRMNMVTTAVPPTAPSETFYSIIYPYLNTFFIAVPNQTSGEQRERPARARPVCSLCKKPMRRHSAVLHSPRNNKE
ncbi:unnamed protein product [Porites evermanni]|uniref:Uncharacterized protein n=1 Tax=Porites evermanni TaxID=104178 RepID=A0ABN8MFU1_9CNID|nr:unnamed protein product [Porites evermanni]